MTRKALNKKLWQAERAVSDFLVFKCGGGNLIDFPGLQALLDKRQAIVDEIAALEPETVAEVSPPAPSPMTNMRNEAKAHGRIGH